MQSKAIYWLDIKKKKEKKKGKRSTPNRHARPHPHNFVIDRDLSVYTDRLLIVIHPPPPPPPHTHTIIRKEEGRKEGRFLFLFRR
jgi:hypothetical protein